MLRNFSDLLAVSLRWFLWDSESSSANSFTRLAEAPELSLRKNHGLTQSTLFFLVHLFELFKLSRKTTERNIAPAHTTNTLDISEKN